MADRRAESPTQRAPSLTQVNVLLLVSLVLILLAGILTSNLHFYWTLLSREVLLILGPALIFVLLLRLPARETLRWRLPDPRVLGASVLVGAGGWLFDIWLGTLFGELLGYTLPLPPDFYPTTLGQALVLFALLSLVAPICEELLFRGLIQRGYEQLGVQASILLTGLLFALFHQSLAQGLALIPLAFLLSYLAWRTDSLLTCVLAHAVNNAPAALLIFLSTTLPQLVEMQDPTLSTGLSSDLATRLSEISPALCALPAALLGGLLVLGGVWGIRRWCPPPPPLQRARLKPGLGRWLGRTWPLLIVVPLTLAVIGVEVVMGRFPELLSMGRPVQWVSPPWTAPQAWRYEVRNALSEPVGTIECELALQEASYVLSCSQEQTAYEVDVGRSTYIGSDLEQELTARWRRSDLRLQSVERRREHGGPWQLFAAEPAGDAVEVKLTTQEEGQRTLRLSLPSPDAPLGGSARPLLPGRTRTPAVIESGEWPWRFSALPFQGVYSAQAALLDPDPSGGGDPALTRAFVLVYGSEPVSTPAGTFVAWRVEVGPEHVAWYDAEAPHTLVALENGIERWVLTSAD